MACFWRNARHIGTLLVAAAATVATATPRADVALSAVCSGYRVCVRDAVNVTWEVKQWDGESELVWVAVHDMTLNRTVARFDVFQYGHSTEESWSSSLELAHPAQQSLERLHSVIYCYNDGPYKVPEVRTVEWSSVDGESMVLKFSDETNRPSLENAAALNNALVFNRGNVEMTAAKGAWSPDGISLTVTDMDSATWQAVVNSISGGTFHAIPRQKLLPVAEVSQGQVSSGAAAEESLRGNLTMRMSSPGRFVVHLYVGDALHSVSAESIDVVDCPEQVVVLDTAGKGSSHYLGSGGHTSSRSAQSGPVALPRSFFSVGGVLAISGDKWLKVPHSIFSNQRVPVGVGGVSTKKLATAGNNSWSIAFWVYLLEDATGSYRGLFYKGDGGDMGRTPSAWLCPDSNRITLRVSSSTDPDVGSDTVASLQSRAWNHVAFSFQNNTKEAFSATVFVNGEVDISVEFRDIDVVGNNGPLHIGRDPTNPGPRCLISSIQLWGAPLSPRQADAVFQASRSLFYGDSSRAMSSRYSAITAVASVISTVGVASSNVGYFLGGEQDAGGFASQEKIGDAAYATATAATATCKTFTERLEMYRVAAEVGHTEGRVRYASLLLAGREELYEDGASCGRDKEPDARTSAEVQWNGGGATIAVNQLELAVRDGSHRAAFMLATVLLSGLDGTNAYGGALEGRARNQAHRVATTSQLAGVGVGAAVFDRWAGAVDSMLRGDRHSETLRVWDVSTTSKAVGLLHFAAVGGNTEAQLALGLRYLDGQGVQLDLETAAWYLGCAADTAHTEYNLVGRQPITEMQRLTEANEPDVAVGQLGEDDAAIQFQIHRAEQGHVPSQVALGDLYYWGARGVPRDQVRSLEYFESAARAGDNTARCAAAGMHLKGEGTEANHTRAVELYEIAAEESHVRALNGLGFEYFYGNVLPRNLTKAYEYFQRAADMKQDADSVFNAGHCLATGTGTDQDLERAAELFRLGAAWGHIGCAYELGIMSAQGRGVERNAAEAAKNLQLVAQVGPWGRQLREAFDCYLQHDILCALALYAQAAELGYEVAASNAAFLLDRGKIRVVGGEVRGAGVMNAHQEGEEPRVMNHRLPSSWVDTMSVRFHIMAATKGYAPSFLAIGDAFFYGKGGLPRDTTAACWWYSRASSSGLVRGSYNLGYLHEHGLGVPRDYDQALMYYDRARSSSFGHDMDQRLNGMPIELLVFVAKGRLHLNRVSGGRFARFWENGGNGDQQHSNTREWLPQQRALPASFLSRAQAFTEWVVARSTPPQVLDLNNRGTDTTRQQRLRVNRDIPSAVYSLLVTDDNSLLLVLLVLLVGMLLLLRRRRRLRSC